MAKIMNWFGLESHPTDTYIHWTQRGKDRLKRAEKLRQAYDKIKDAGLVKDLETLLSAAFEAGQDDEHDANAGPEI